MTRLWSDQLSNCATILMGQSPSSSTFSETDDGLPFIQGNAEFGPRHPSPRLHCSAPTRIAESGDFLLSVRAPVGEINQASCRIVIGRGLSAIRFSPEWQNFAWHAMKWAAPKLDQIAQGSTFLAVSRQDVEQLEIPWGDLTVCQAVAGVLDTLDEVIAQTEILLAKQKRLRAGFIYDLLSRGLDAQGRLRDPATHCFKPSPLGLIPTEWDVRTLADVVPAHRPIVYGILMPGKYVDGGVPVIKVKDIQDGSIRKEGLLRTHPKIDAAYSRSRLLSGDLLFTIRGTVGRTAVVPAELGGANITQDTARITVADGNTTFIRHCLEMPRQRSFIELHTLGQAVKGINLGELRKLPVQFPHPDEQAEIAHVLDEHERDTRVLVEQLEKLRRLKSGLTRDLLTNRVPVIPLLQEEVAAEISQEVATAR